MDEVNLLKTFGLHLKSLRREKSLSQEELALIASLDRTYISGIERGLRNVSLINLFKIAEALELPAYQLLDFKLEE
jgi:transcriptional regulator with XRE-family HTH domain